MWQSECRPCILLSHSREEASTCLTRNAASALPSCSQLTSSPVPQNPVSPFTTIGSPQYQNPITDFTRIGAPQYQGRSFGPLRPPVPEVDQPLTTPFTPFTTIGSPQYQQPPQNPFTSIGAPQYQTASESGRALQDRPRPPAQQWVNGLCWIKCFPSLQGLHMECLVRRERQCGLNPR